MVLLQNPFTMQALTSFRFRNASSCKKNRICESSVASYSTTTTAFDHVSFIKDVTGLKTQPHLESLLKVLEAKGERIVSPYSRKGILPLTIPLSENATSGVVTALLRWPTPPEGLEVPIVALHKHGVLLLAKSMDAFIHRSIVEEDIAQDAGDAIYTAAGDIGKTMYQRGDYHASKFPNVDSYLMKRVGLFPDVFERLALSHLDRGDEISALITGEYYASRKHFPGFGRPFVFNAQLLLKLGRKCEAKDAAKIALKAPWWTLGSSYENVAEMAGWGDEQVSYMRERITEQGRQEDLNKGKCLAQVALDQAAFLLDLAAVDGSWDDVRQQLTSFYQEADMTDIVRFIQTTC